MLRLSLLVERRFPFHLFRARDSEINNVKRKFYLMESAEVLSKYLSTYNITAQQQPSSFTSSQPRPSIPNIYSGRQVSELQRSSSRPALDKNKVCINSQATTEQQSEAAFSCNPSSISSKITSTRFQRRHLMTTSHVANKELSSGARVMNVFSGGPFDEQAALAVLGSHQISKESANESTHALLRSLIASGIITQQGTRLQLAPNTKDDTIADKAAELRYLQHYIHQLGQAVNFFESGSFSSGLAIIDGARVHFDRILFEMDLPPSILLDLFDALILGEDCLFTRWTAKQMSAFYYRVLSAVETDAGKQLVEHDLIFAWSCRSADRAIDILKNCAQDDKRALLVAAQAWDLKFNRLYCSDSFQESLVSAKNALSIRIKILGEDHTETAKSFMNIGAAHIDIGNHDLALDYYNKALDIRKSKLGDNHVSTAASYNYIGNVYISKGDYDLALEYYKKSLAIKQAVLGEKHIDTADSNMNIGTVYRSKGDYDLALEYHKKSLAITQAVLGEKHTDTAASYNNIGNVYYSKGDYNLALEYYKKSLEIHQAVLGEQHTLTAASYGNIGNVYISKGDYDLALEYYKKSFAIKQAVFGENHADTAASYVNIGNVYISKGDYDLALEYYKKSLAIKQAVLGEKHIDTADSNMNIGTVYQSKGDYDLALEYHKKSLAIKQAVLGEKHKDTAASYNNIGNVYYSKGDCNLAFKYYKKALSIQISIVDEDHPEVATSLYNMALVHQKKNNMSSARECAQKAFDILHRRLGPHHEYTKNLKYFLQFLASTN